MKVNASKYHPDLPIVPVKLRKCAEITAFELLEYDQVFIVLNGLKQEGKHIDLSAVE